jgi:hypothetical protein
MSGAYTRTHGVPPSGRDSTIPRFHYESVPNPAASSAAGRPRFDQQERVQFIQPGNTNQPVVIVTEEHIERWPKQYEAFKRGAEMSVDGTPLEMWPVLNRNQVLEMKGVGLHSVEQCAAMSDLAIQKIGMGGQKIRELARAYLDEADQMAVTTAAVDRAEKAETRNAELTREVQESRALIESLHRRLMTLENAPSSLETYRPGDHDPMQRAAQEAPRAPLEPSSLDSLENLPSPRRRAKEAA